MKIFSERSTTWFSEGPGEVGEILFRKIRVVVVIVVVTKVDEASRPDAMLEHIIDFSHSKRVNLGDLFGFVSFLDHVKNYPSEDFCFTPKATAFFFLELLAAMLALRACKACKVSRLQRSVGFDWLLNNGGIGLVLVFTQSNHTCI